MSTRSGKTPKGKKANANGTSSAIAEHTDKTRWRMLDDDGRQTWHYLADDKEAEKWPQSLADKYYLSLPLDVPELPKAQTPLEAVHNGLEFFEKLQQPPGNWACEYGGPLFLMTGIIVAWIVTDTPIPEPYKIEMRNYIFARAHKDDGGWGLHIESDSSVFGTSMNYLNLRLLGVPADDPRAAKARATLHKLGGAQKSPHWAKFWLSVLGIAKWDIVNPIPPEFWLMPNWVPVHPWRWWIHIRQVFLPTGYIYSKRWTYPETPLIRELQQEMFTEEWSTLDWKGHRNSIAPQDNFHPKTWILNLINWILVNIWLALLRPNWLKTWGESHAFKLIEMEDANTDFSDLAPVSAPMNTIACFIEHGSASHPSVVRHIERLEDYLWVKSEGMLVNGTNGRLEDYLWVKSEGMLVNGTNGVQNWDTAFAIQAVVDSGLATSERWRPMLTKALHYLDAQQIREEVPGQAECYRQTRKGGWAFSNKDQGYAVSDCIAEALKSVIMLQRTPGYPTLLDDRRIFDAIDTLLTFQNSSGGCASYEPQRGSEYLELLNAAEVFGRIMVEYDYPECTTAVVTALSLFSTHWPDYRAKEIATQKARMVQWIKTNQAADGSWYGSWGICFTYATMFALESLEAIGETYENSGPSKRGCDFLVSHQREDGGWSESYRGCETCVYTEHPSGSLVVQTAWAVLGLMYAEYPDRSVIERGVRFIMSRQQGNGEWLQEAIEGVFNKSAMISYPNYKFTFVMMAVGRWGRLEKERAESGKVGGGGQKVLGATKRK
ncbi:hypothetical protein V495_03482 [Pseudogymnoascus sp. VKM F-4514 (FW-929)]|nr:hypothetical protein V495_03482 [Pseudogymnoascus sp. VKM F-4514 (FW-929)]